MNFKPTAEQAEIVATNTDILMVEAGAGASKTTTLRLYAEARPRENMLYLAFNSAIKEEAEKIFPQNVKVMTAHGMAFAKVGKNYLQKMSNNLSPFMVINSLNLRTKVVPASVAITTRAILDTINGFLYSIDQEITTDSVIIDRALPGAAGLRKETIAAFAADLWEKMKDLENPTPMTHDGYLKLFALERHPIGPYRRIMVDEFQDTNPVLLDILQRNQSPKIYVGDRNQAIYQFRGSIDAMSKVVPTARLRLSQSFRFGDHISEAANRILMMKGEKNFITGARKDQDNIAFYDDSLDIKADKTMYLSFGAAGVFDHAIRAAKKNIPMFFSGGINNYRFSNLEDVYNLKYGAGPINDPLIKLFDDYDDLMAYGETDKEVESKCKLVNEHERQLPELIKRVQGLAVDKSDKAGIILSTGHRAKGLEADQVVIGDDFSGLVLKNYFEYDELAEQTGVSLMEQIYAGTAERKAIKPEQANLAYVAVTRGKKRVLLPENARELIKNADLGNQLFHLEAQHAVYEVATEVAQDNTGVPAGGALQSKEEYVSTQSSSMFTNRRRARM